MEGPLLTKSEHIVDTTIDGDPSSNDDQIQFARVQSYVPSNRYEGVWDLIELVMALVQIVAALVVLTRTKDEHTETTWIISYTCGCIVSLPVLYWRICHYEDVNSDMGTKMMMGFSYLLLQIFFSCWFVMFTWFFLAESSVDHSIPLFWLCFAFLAFSRIRLVQKCVSACL